MTSPASPFQAVLAAVPRQDWALCAAEMFYWATPRPLVVAICLAGEDEFVKIVEQSNGYAEFGFQPRDIRAMFRMLKSHVQDELTAMDAKGAIHV